MHPNRDEAAAALVEIDAARRAVEAESERGLAVMLTTTSALVVLDYAAKDYLPDRVAERAVSAICAIAGLGACLMHLRSNQVQPVSVDPNDLGFRAAAPMFAVLAGSFGAERLLVRRLRKSRLRRPNTVAGAILALERLAMYPLVLRLTPKPRTS